MGKTRLETDYLIVVRPEPSRPGGPNVHQRLRSLLKAMKRTYGLRCVTIAPDVPCELEPPDAGLDVGKNEPPFA